MEGEEVGDREHLVLGRCVVDPELAKALVRHEGVIGDDVHPETDSPPRDLLADPTEAEDAERLPLELDATPGRALPAALLECGVRLRDVPGERHHQAHGLLGGGDDGRLRCVCDDDSPSRRGVDVDVVDAHTRASDHLQIGRSVDQLGSELRRRPDDDCVVVADDLLERRRLVEIDVELRPQELHSGFGDRFPDEDAHRHCEDS